MSGILENLVPEGVRKLVPELEDVRNLVPESSAQKTVAAGAVLLGTKWIYNKMSAYRERSRLTKLRNERRASHKLNVENKNMEIMNDEHALKDKDIITKIASMELVEKIKKGELTSLRVLRAFQARTLESHEKTNAVNYFFAEAEEMAMERDKNPSKEGRLYGLPISVKDTFHLKGYDTVYGVSDEIGEVAEETCLFLKRLINEGAVPYVRTNVPQLMISMEGSNPIYGPTRNPHNPKRGPGGSSSGEGALVGDGASPLGLGSDIGGSIRHPANFCGCVGFKPTSYRISQKDAPKFNRGQTAVNEVYGPLGPDVDSVVECMKCLWDDPEMFAADTKIPPLMFNHEMYEEKRPLKIGIYFDLPGTLPIVPAVKRAVNLAKQALESQGHIIVPWTPPDTIVAYQLWFQALYANEMKDSGNAVEHDAIDPCIRYMIETMSMTPWWIKKVKYFFQSFYDPEGAFLTNISAGVNNAQGYFDIYEAIQDYRDLVSDSMKAAGLDACINPPMPYPAMPLFKTGGQLTEKFYIDTFVYSAVYNVLNWPAGIVPITKVTMQDVKDMSSFPENSKLTKMAQAGMVGSEGLPLSCQVIARQFRDEMVLRVMKELETGLKRF